MGGEREAQEMATMVRRTKYRVPDATPERVHEVLQGALAPLETRPGFLLRLKDREFLNAILTAPPCAEGATGKPADVPGPEGVPEWKCWMGETLPSGDEGFSGCYMRRDPGGVPLLLTYSIGAAADGRSVAVELEWEQRGVATRTPARDLYLHTGAWQRLLEDALRQAGFAPQKRPDC